MGNDVKLKNEVVSRLDHPSFSQMLNFYLSIGLEIIPLKYNTKIPAVKGWKTMDAKDQWEYVFNLENGFSAGPYNLGVRLGKVCDLENDDEVFGKRLDKRLNKLIGCAYPKYKSYRGYHRLIIVKNAPDQSVIHWKDRKLTKAERDLLISTHKKEKVTTHSGELRIKGCQSVLPFSTVIDESGEKYKYFWCGDYEAALKKLPTIRWNDIRDLVKDYIRKSKRLYNKPELQKSDYASKLENKFYYILKMCRESPGGSPIACKDNEDSSQSRTYKSRSEAEYAVLARMITCGYSFEEAYATFEKERPGHYYNNYPDNQSDRKEALKKEYDKLIASSIRISIKKEYELVVCKNIADQVYCVLLGLAYQYNTNEIVQSYSNLCKYCGFDNKNKTSIRNACYKLEKLNIIEITPGSKIYKDHKASVFKLLKITN